MYTAPDKVILGEKLFSGTASITLAAGMVLALVSVSGTGKTPRKAQQMLSTFDLSAAADGDTGSRAASPPPASQTPPPPPKQPETPKPGRVEQALLDIGAAGASAAQQEAKAASAPAKAGKAAQADAGTALAEAESRPMVRREHPPIVRKQEGGAAPPSGTAAGSSYKTEIWRHLLRYRRPNVVGPGSAFVSFDIDGNGAVTRLGVVQSSGSRRFDDEAMQMVRRAQPFPRPPVGVARAFTFEIKGG